MMDKYDELIKRQAHFFQFENDRCRMKTRTQSYDLYDSKQFNSIKDLKEILEENEEYNLASEDK
jgi:hypothetical protein